jgi:Flp pilus assembly protein TadD
MRLHHAVSLAEQGRRADAEQAMRALLRDDPGFAEAAGNLATLLLQAHLQQPAERRSAADPALAEAEALLARAAAGEPLRAGWHNSLGWLRELRGEPALAEPAYRRACALDPLRPEPAVSLVRLLLRAGRLNDARAAVAESCRAAPAAVPLRLLLADQLWQLDRELATGLLHEVLRLDPGNAAAAAALAASRR